MELSFFQWGNTAVNSLSGVYDFPLIILPYFLAIAGSYLGLDIFNRLRMCAAKFDFLWLLLGAFSMGGTLWATQLISILAFNFNFPIHYDIIFVVLSFFLAIISFFVTYLVVINKNFTLATYFGIGVFLGPAIAAIYYILIGATSDSLGVYFIPGLFSFSVLLSILGTTAMFWLLIKSSKQKLLQPIKWKILVATLMGTGIYLFHFLSLQATIFTANPQYHFDGYGMDETDLVEIILSILMLVLIISVFKQVRNLLLKEKNLALLATEQTLRRQREELLKINSELHVQHQALEACPNAIIVTDARQPNTPIIYVNSAFVSITGYTAAEVLGKNCRFLQGNDHKQPELEKLHMLLQERQSGTVILRNYRKDGTLFWNELHLAPVKDDHGSITHFIGVIIDITQRKFLETQLTHHATHDRLTNLPNRALLLDRLEQAITHAERNRLLIAVLFFDLDRFKTINDYFGHKVGDEVLKIVAVRMKQILRSTDTIARLGGDEFVAVLTDLVDDSNLMMIIEKCQKVLYQDFLLHEHRLVVGASIGISMYPKDGKNSETLLKCADLAMYRAKEIGRNNFQFYNVEMNITTQKHLEFQLELRQALEKREFVLYYQPFVDLQTKKIVGAEALIRWNHPKNGLLLPHDFLHLAEEVGLLGVIDEWVLRTACMQNKAWQVSGLQPLVIAVNVSAQEFKKQNFPQLVKKVLKEADLAACYLELELSENIVMKDQEAIIPELWELKKAGVGLVIDDFGVGYSSLVSLKNLPADKIKIDRAFVHHLQQHASDAVIVTAIIGIAKNLGLKVLAEGVESKEQLEFLAQHLCDEVQGFYFSKAIPVEAFVKLLQMDEKAQDFHF